MVGNCGGTDLEWLVVGDRGQRQFIVVGGWRSWPRRKRDFDKGIIGFVRKSAPNPNRT